MCVCVTRNVYLHTVHAYTSRDLVVVFNCSEGHCMCVDCFKQYCETKLTSRQFVEKSIGYTLLCPNECVGSEVTEMHHFRMLGKDLVRNMWCMLCTLRLRNPGDSRKRLGCGQLSGE